MKSITTFNGTVAILLFLTTLSANAQSIPEKDLKTNISAIEKPIEKLQQLEPIYYSFNTDKLVHLKLATSSQYGFKLQSAQATFPSLIKTENKSYSAGKNNIKNATYQELDTKHLIPVLVAALQEQQKSIEALKKEIALLKQKD